MDNDNGGGCLFSFWLVALLVGGAIIFMGQTAEEITVDGVQTSTYPAVEIVLSPSDTGITWDDLQAAYSVIDRRLLALSGTGQIESGYTIDSSRPDMTIVIRFSEGTASTQDVLAVLLESGYIEFVDLSTVDPSNLSAYGGQTIATTASVERSGDNSEQLVFPTILTQEDILQATVINGTAEGPGSYMIQIDLTQMGAERLGTFSEANIGSGLAVVLDGVVLSVPTIQGRIETPISLTGTFTEAEAVALAAQINSRPLPIAMSVQTVTYILPPE